MNRRCCSTRRLPTHAGSPRVPRRALELAKVALRIHRPATTLYDMTAQALLSDSSDKRERMSRFLAERAARRGARKETER